MNSVHIQTPCRICHTVADHELYQVREMMLGTRQSFDYFQCNVCQTLQIVNIPHNMASFYPPHYGPFQRLGRVMLWVQGRRLNWTLFRDSLIGRFLVKLKGPSPLVYFLRDLIPFRDKTILDVGCGQGTLLREMHAAGFRHLVGSDAFASPETPPFRMIAKAFLDVHERFDVLMFNHSLEHMPDIAQTFRHADTLLNLSGRIVVRIPLLAQAWKTYGVHWVQLDAPRHFYLMHADAFRAVAAQQGFETLKTVYDSSALQFWGSEQYKTDVGLHEPTSYAVNPKASRFSSTDIENFSKQAVRLNEAQQGDSGYFLLKRKTDAT